jgi:hypothetical protein
MCAFRRRSWAAVAPYSYKRFPPLSSLVFSIYNQNRPAATAVCVCRAAMSSNAPSPLSTMVR